MTKRKFNPGDRVRIIRIGKEAAGGFLESWHPQTGDMGTISGDRSDGAELVKIDRRHKRKSVWTTHGYYIKARQLELIKRASE